MEAHTPHILFLLFTVSLLTTTTADDGAAMLALAKAFSTPPLDWSTTSSAGYCKWSGVRCSSDRVNSISLEDKSLSGGLAPEISTLSELKTITVQRNKLTGKIPSLAKLASLQSIYIDGNLFDGVEPGAFAGLTSLQIVSMSDNPKMSPWSFPSELADSTSLTTIYLDNTTISGVLPDIFHFFTSLQNLRLSYNNITGPLPPSLAKSTTIRNFWINNQLSGLSGTIQVLSGMTSLSQVWLHKNQFTGSIPDLSKSENLFDLQLRDNQLTGIVSPALLPLGSLKNISLDNNKLQGPLPSLPPVEKVTANHNYFCTTKAGHSCDDQVTTLLAVAGGLGYPSMLADSWQGNDACGSWAYVTCNSARRIITLNFANQGFKGLISPAIGHLPYLKNAYFNNNNLTGVVPTALVYMPNLKLIDVSENNLTGEILKFPDPVMFIHKPGNDFLGTNAVDSSSWGSKTRVIFGVTGGAVVLAFLGFVVYVIVMKKRYRKLRRTTPENAGKVLVSDAASNGNNGNLNSPKSAENSDFLIPEGASVAIPMEVLREITNNFSEANILGRGGFGAVYAGELHDGTKTAVKRMQRSAGSGQGVKEFQAEIAILSKVRHRHLVALLGYCVNGSERLIVYELMPQGHLGHHLFKYGESGRSPLTWKQRLSIALDVARGVEYLHGLAQQSFIHRDLKPSNILLGDDMRAKVADFGLVKKTIDGNHSVSTKVGGTFGYLAPEVTTGRVTTKVDVYSFGVVLMEMITGRKALDFSLPDERSHLATWFRRILINKENIPKAIDQALEQDEETLESIHRVAELAGHCTAPNPHDRPDMGHAVNVLGPLVGKWKPSCQEGESFGIDVHNMSLPLALQKWQQIEGTWTSSC